MRLIILSDIHANLEAFTEVLAWVDRSFQGREVPDRIISLGDNIGYGPDPNGVMEIICERNILSVLGNHEMAVLNPAFLACFNPVAKKAADHTRSHLLPAFKQVFGGWSQSLVVENLLFVHGSPPESPFVYLFQLSDVILQRKMEAMDQWVCFTGHTHDLELIVLDNGNLTHQELGQGEIFLDRQKKYIVNAGSVGQPRDGNPSAKIVVFDMETGRLEVVFVPYDCHTTAMKIRRTSIPDVYADKLLKRF
ncbi:serine/threonine protein phosphatase [Desulforapulum autotrophicum HRM2]|uniref:Serine/threonine protein phosphatase n=1 Tax=Desulforapulum autotrophicum (strain ATCC 43914 / DSM 3382 / VKM B-1955 / HRM2) TaxID=177437 RepID=C0QLM7_DESAH|nr:metallophosphoesterase family protein [Desulforapulum autotrophicum]ACN16331.1 serine/threonine protein phosphatase [Desulforapulum autotrophicum HRM2]